MVRNEQQMRFDSFDLVFVFVVGVGVLLVKQKKNWVRQLKIGYYRIYFGVSNRLFFFGKNTCI